MIDESENMIIKDDVKLPITRCILQSCLLSNSFNSYQVRQSHAHTYERTFPPKSILNILAGHSPNSSLRPCSGIITAVSLLPPVADAAVVACGPPLTTAGDSDTSDTDAPDVDPDCMDWPTADKVDTVEDTDTNDDDDAAAA